MRNNKLKHNIMPTAIGIGISPMFQQGAQLNLFALATNVEDGAIEILYTNSEDGTPELILINTEDR